MPQRELVPACLRDYITSPVLERSAQQVKRFEQRMAYILELCESTEEWTANRSESAYVFLDNLDNDVNVILASGLGNDVADSTYLIHTSWTADVSAAAMYESLPKDLLAYLCAGLDRFLLSDSEVDQWLVAWGGNLRLTLDLFADSTTVDAAVGRLLALDLFLQKIACFITILRFNTLIKRD